MVRYRNVHNTIMKSILSTVLFLALLPLAAPPLSAISLIGGDSFGKGEELLDPETAFASQALVTDQGELQVDINIAEGYFLYKSKIKVESEHARFGSLNLPAGIVKDDQFFGKVETYRDLLTFKSSIDTQIRGPLSVTLISQGCADIGVCYPPQRTSLTVEIPAAFNASTIATSSTTTPASSSAKSTGLIGSSLLDRLKPDSSDSEVLDPEVAFVLTIEPSDNNYAVISWNIADGHYMYRDKFDFTLVSPEHASIGEIELTPGQLQSDEFFGEVEVNRNFASARVAVNNLQTSNKASIKVRYQGCADIGVCYPPQYKVIEAAFNSDAGVAALATTTNPTSGGSISVLNEAANEVSNAALNVASNTAASTSVNRASVVSEQDRLASSLKSGSRLTTIATFFGLGLLLAFTPCVLPMVPILSSLIVGQGDSTSPRKAFSLSLIYVLAMALTYTIAGVLVGLSGENIQIVLQHPAILITFALLFVFLAASMFGLFKLEMPSLIQNKLTSVSNKQQGGSFGGVAVMGVLSALIVGPCITAPLVGALIYIGQTGDAVLGGAALFALSMGMGVPLLIIGTSFGKYLPAVGPWMNTINAVFGVMLLAVAIWMLERVIPAWGTMILAAMLLISVGFFMGAFDTVTTQYNHWRKLSRGFGYAAIVYGTLLIIGLATGQGSLLRPLQGLALSNQSAGAPTEHVAFSRIKGVDELNTALASAKSAGKPVILDFYADWCISCKEMEAFTFTDPAVAAKMNQAVLLQTDVTANDIKDKELLRKFSLYGPPAIIFYTPEGDEIDNARVVGYMNADKFGNHLDIVL